jgi:hypothetical protein
MSEDAGTIDPSTAATQVDAEDVDYSGRPDGLTSQESQIVAPPGGIKTNEVGVVTGDVVVRTSAVATGSGEGVAVTISTAGSSDVYTVNGSPLTQPTSHNTVLDHLATDRGVGPDGTQLSNDVTDLTAQS